MEWKEDVVARKIDGVIKSYQMMYKDKLLLIHCIKESPFQAAIICSIIESNLEDESEVETYHYQKILIGSDSQFYKRINNVIKYKQNELELIASDMDFI